MKLLEEKNEIFETKIGCENKKDSSDLSIIVCSDKKDSSDLLIIVCSDNI